MTHRTTAPYGSWKSPISSDLIVSETIGLGEIKLDASDIYWTEMRPSEKGRYAIVRRTPDGKTNDATPPWFNARTRVHEYGGGAYLVIDGTVYASHYSDQRVYRLAPGSDPQALTPTSDLRYADGVCDPLRHRLICVREDHTVAGKEAVNSLVGVDPRTGGKGEVLVSGHDFYSSPRLSPDGSKLAWLAWNHPNMPWDGTELWIAGFDRNGVLVDIEQVAGGPEESIVQPEWSPEGVLTFISDRSGWWNLYRRDRDQVAPICRMEAEFGKPPWVFGMSTYAFLSANRLICCFCDKGTWQLGYAELDTGDLERIETPYTEIGSLKAAQGRAVFSAGSPTEPTSVVQLDVTSGELEVLRRSSQVTLDAGYLSVPETVEFPTEGGLTAYGFYYPPVNCDFEGPRGERPPLLVKSHGGPTAAASTALNLGIQFWTSRGFAVLDVNYGGSTGYGRAYRERLNDHWGIVDVDDCVNGARCLVDRGLVDGQRLAIDGGSAGGYTTLCALTFRDVFKAGASYYGVTDLEALNEDTHKFESRYSDRLVGPYPKRRDIYRERSPIHFTDRLSCPVILFQGLEDRIVPPNQAELMVDALRQKGLPVAYLAFEGEQHGFRQAENIKRCLDAEFYFYSRIFGFEPADPIEPVLIENL